uniref:Peptidase S1 domain-containing protein n=1 Tax=Steinernema glaseri TaxID=37863 RepID=A0A1I8AJA7_9BILA
MVAFQAIDREFCGGTIVGGSWILTAAHCVLRTYDNFVRTEDLFIRVGHGTRDEEVYPVRRIVVSRMFNITTFRHDIALIQKFRFRNPSESPATSNAFVSRRTTYHQEGPPRQWVSDTQVGSTCVSPHDQHSVGGVFSASRRLMEVTGRVKPSKCRHPNFHQKENLCFVADDASVCDGDSGGPLLSGSFQVGIVSRALTTCPPEGPGIFTKVPYYCDAIKRLTDGDVACGRCF